MALSVTPRRYTDAELYETAQRHGDQTAAAAELGISTSWLAKRTRAYAKATGLEIPRNRNGGQPVVVRAPRPPDVWSHRRLRDGGVRVREQRRQSMDLGDLCGDTGIGQRRAEARQNRTWPPA